MRRRKGKRIRGQRIKWRLEEGGEGMEEEGKRRRREIGIKRWSRIYMSWR
jgi:hypothetical protein